MSHIVDNAIIMAAGTSSRFAPLSYEMPKALITVNGEVLIERQIRQLQEVGIADIIIVTGYKKEQFEYLKDTFGVILVENTEYLTRNNNSSIYAVRSYLKNSYICSADNYFSRNPFELKVDDSYYAAIFSEGSTDEWCIKEDNNGYICDIKIGGSNSWYMLGHVFWSEDFSKRFIEILEREYDLPETGNLLWESIFANHLEDLKMKIRHYPSDVIFEFDTLDELRQFDSSYYNNTRSHILHKLASQHQVLESEITNVIALKGNTNDAIGFQYEIQNIQYQYFY